MKKIICLLLAAITLTLCLGVVSCAEEPAPAGMQDVTAEGESYRLFVPIEGWEKLTGKGGSAAVCADGSNVTLTRYLPATVEESKPENYWKYFLEPDYKADYAAFVPAEGYAQYAEDGSVSCVGKDVEIGGKGGKQYVFYVTHGQVTHKQLQVLVQAPDADMYIFTYTAKNDELFNAHLADVEAILAAFRFG